MKVFFSFHVFNHSSSIALNIFSQRTGKIYHSLIKIGSLPPQPMTDSKFTSLPSLANVSLISLCFHANTHMHAHIHIHSLFSCTGMHICSTHEHCSDILHFLCAVLFLSHLSFISFLFLRLGSRFSF